MGFVSLGNNRLKKRLCSPNRTRRILEKGKNMLFFGDNLQIMRESIPDEFVDLIYIDPPFNSKKTYAISFEQNGIDKKVKEKAYEDTWKWKAETEKESNNLTAQEYHGLRVQLDFLRNLILENNAIPDSYMAYIVMMATRLVELKRVLKPSGTLYLHCDPTMSHYLKILLDCVFGVENFRNEIVWCYAGGGIPRKDYPRKHDIILRYTKSKEYVFNVEYKPYGKHILKSKTRATSNRGRRKLEYNEEGTPITDWWDDINPVINWSAERTGYPTQKPLTLMERIIKASTNEGEIVLDAFCGSATTMEASSNLNRKWIGIDLSMLAISTAIQRINEVNTANEYYLMGFPQSIEQVEKIIAGNKSNCFKFEYCINNLLGAIPNKKRQDNGGVKGTLYFKASKNTHLTRKLLTRVKMKGVGLNDIFELNKEVEEDETVNGGYLVCLKKSQITKEMKKSIAQQTDISDNQYARNTAGNPSKLMTDNMTVASRISILTVEEIIQEKEPHRLIKHPSFVKET